MNSKSESTNTPNVRFENASRRWFPHDHMVLIEKFRHEGNKHTFPPRRSGGRL